MSKPYFKRWILSRPNLW